MAQSDEILLSLDEIRLLFVEGPLVVEEPSETTVVSLAGTLEGIKFPRFDDELVVVDKLLTDGA